MSEQDLTTWGCCACGGTHSWEGNDCPELYDLSEDE